MKKKFIGFIIWASITVLFLSSCQKPEYDLPVFTTTLEDTTEEVDDTTEVSGPNSSFLRVSFLDVGQADATLIECDGHYALIDGGNRADSQFLYSYLKSHGIDHLELIVATHPHEDHIGGLPGVLSYSSADKILSNTLEYDSTYFFAMKEFAAKAGAMMVVPILGEEYPLGGSSLKVIAVNSGNTENDKSIVVKLIHGQISILFMSDAGVETENDLLSSNMQIRSTILRIGHHGSSTSTSQRFLRVVEPQYVIISVGKDNQFGHPTSDVLARMLEDDISFYRTDLNGSITAISDGFNVSITSEKAASYERMIQSGEFILPAPENSIYNDDSSVVTYVINTSSRKFHYFTCKSVENIKEANKAFFSGDRCDLVEQGYNPCGSCHP